MVFSAQKVELEGEYQKQVDDMLFFDYRCFMKKHDITQDSPNYPSNDENEAAGGLAQEGGDVAKVSPSGGQT